MKKTKKGFTLIELIVVITILAVLAIIAIPVVTGWVDKAHDSANAANKRTIELAAKAYMTEHDDRSLDTNDLNDALSAFEIANPIAGSKAAFRVSSNGAVTVMNPSGSPGAIYLQ